MKKLISLKQLCTAVHNMSKAIATIQNVAPMSRSTIEQDIKCISNHFCTFYIIIDKHYSCTSIRIKDDWKGDHIKLEVNIWDGKYYVEI